MIGWEAAHFLHGQAAYCRVGGEGFLTLGVYWQAEEQLTSREGFS